MFLVVYYDNQTKYGIPLLEIKLYVPDVGDMFIMQIGVSNLLTPPNEASLETSSRINDSDGILKYAYDH